MAEGQDQQKEKGCQVMEAKTKKTAKPVSYYGKKHWYADRLLIAKSIVVEQAQQFKFEDIEHDEDR